MPIPEQCFDVWSMDFISGLPSSQGYNIIYTYIDKFTNFVGLIPCFKGEGALSTPECANLFFSTSLDCLVYQKWYCMIVIQGLLLTFGRPYGNF